MVKRKRALAFTGSFILLFLAATPLVYLAVSRKAATIVVDLQSFIRKEMGLELSISSVSPSILTSLTLNNIQFSRPDGSVLLSAGRFAVRYSLLALIAGDSRHAVKEVRLEKMKLAIDISADMETAERIRKLLGPGKASTPPPILVRLSDSSVELLDGSGGVYRLDSGLITFSTREALPSLSLLNGRYSIETAPKGFKLSGPVEFGLSLDAILSSFKGKILAGLESGGFPVSGRNLIVSFDGSKFTLSHPASDGLAFAASIDLAEKNLSASMDFKDFIPSRIVKGTVNPAQLRELADSQYSGSIRLRLPGLDVKRAEYAVDFGSVGGESALSIRAEGRGMGVTVREARVETHGLRARFAGQVGLDELKVAGQVGVEVTGSGGEKIVVADLGVSGEGGEYRMTGSSAMVGGENYEDPEIGVKVAGEVVEVEGGLGRGEGGAGREVAVKARVETGKEARVEGEAGLAGMRLGSVSAVYDAVTGRRGELKAIEGMRATGRVYVTSDFRKVSWNALTMKVRGAEGFGVDFAGTGNAEYAEVKEVRVEVGGKGVEGEGRVDFGQKGGVKYRVKAKYEGVEYGIGGEVTAEGTIVARGDYGVEVEAQKREGGGYAVRIAAQGVPIPLGKGNGVVNATVRGRGVYRSGTEWEVETGEFALEGAGGKESGIPTIRGSLKGSAGEIEMAEVAVEGWGRRLKGPVTIRYGEKASGGVDVKGVLDREVVAGDVRGQESWRVEAAYRDGTLSGSVGLKGFPIRRLFPTAPDAEADGYVSFDGPFDLSLPGNPAGSGTIRAQVMAGLRSADFDVAEQRFDLSYDGRKVEMRMPEKRGIAIAASYDIAAKDIAASVIARDFSLSDLVDLKKTSKDVSAFVGMPLSGHVDFEIPGGNFEKTVFSAKLAGQTGKIVSQPPAAAKTSPAGTEPSISVADRALYLDVEGTPSNIFARKVSLTRGPDKAEFVGRIGLVDKSIDGSAAIAMGSDGRGSVALKGDFTIRGARNAFTISAPLVTFGNARAVETVLDFSIPPEGRLDFASFSVRLSSELQWNGAAYSLSGSTSADGILIVRGDHGLRLRITQTADDFAVEASAEEIPLPFSQDLGVMNASFALVGGFKNPSDWHFDFSRFDIHPAGGKESRLPDILAKVLARPGSISVSRLQLGSGSRNLVGKAEIRYPTTTDGSASLKGSLAAEGESWNYDVSVAKGLLSGKAEVQGFRLSRIPGVSMDGVLDGFIDVEGPLNLSRVFGTASAFGQERTKTALKARVMAGFRSPGFNVSEQRFDVDFDGMKLGIRKASKGGVSALASLDVGSGDLELTLALSRAHLIDSMTVKAPPSWLSDFLAMSYSGTASARLPGLDVKRAEYAVDFGSVGGESALSIRAEGRGMGVTVREARVETHGLRARFAGQVGLDELKVAGQVGVEVTGSGGEKIVVADLGVSGEGGEYRMTGSSAMVGGENYEDPEIGVKVAGEVVEVEGGLGRGEGGAGREVAVKARVETGKEARVEGEAGLAGMRLGSVSAVYDAVTGRRGELKAIEGMRATGRVYVTSDFRKVSWNALTMKVRGAEGFGVDFAGTGNAEYAEVKEVRVEVGGKGVEGEGRVDFGQKGGVKYRVKAKYEGVEYGIGGEVTAEGTIVARGDYGVEVEAQKREGGGYAVRIAAQGVPIPLGKGNGVVNATVRGRGVYRSGTEWEVETGEFALEGAGGKESGIPTIRGSLKGSAGEIEMAEVAVEGWGRRLKGPVTIRYGEKASGGVDVKGVLDREVVAGDVRGQESWRVEAAYRDGTLSGSVGLKGFPIERFFADSLSWQNGASGMLNAATASVAGSLTVETGNPDAANTGSIAQNTVFSPDPGAKAAAVLVPGIHGEIDAEFSFDGPLNLGSAGLSGFPHSVFSGNLVNGEFNSVPMSLSFEGNMSNGIIGVTDIDAAYVNHDVKNATISLDPTAGSLDFAIPYTAVLGNDRLQTVISGSGTSGAPLGSSFTSIVDSYNLKIAVRSLTYRKLEITDWRAEILSQNGSISITSERDEVIGRYNRDGNFELRTSKPIPVAATVKGSFRDGIIDADVSDFALDFSEIGSDASTDLVRIKKGKASGAFKVSGSLDDPDLNGTLDLKDVVVMLQGYLDEPIGPFSVPLVLDNKSLHFSAPRVSIGNGAGELSLQASLDHWNLASLTIKLDTKGDATVGVSGKIAGILVEKGAAHINLTAELKGDLLELAGTMNLESGDVVVNPSLFLNQGEPRVRQDGLKVYVDARFGFGRKVQVYLPSKDLPLVTGSADPSSALKLIFDQESGDFKLDGTLVLRGGYAFYYLRNFFLKSGQVEFAESNVFFDPKISLSAELREVDSKGPVTVTLSADRNPLSNLHPRLSSDPTMTEAQLVSLLSGGVLSTGSSGEVGLREAFIGSSEFLPQFNIVKAFEWRVREALGLDVFYIRSGFFQRWLYDISQPLAASSSLGSYLDNTYLYAGKFLGTSAFVHAALRLREDPLVTPTNLRLDSEFSVEFETPFGLLRWNVSPRLSDSLFISDQSLSLSWKISF